MDLPPERGRTRPRQMTGAETLNRNESRKNEDHTTGRGFLQLEASKAEFHTTGVDKPPEREKRARTSTGAVKLNRRVQRQGSRKHHLEN
jgi:hypothetical protein